MGKEKGTKSEGILDICEGNQPTMDPIAKRISIDKRQKPFALQHRKATLNFVSSKVSGMAEPYYLLVLVFGFSYPCFGSRDLLKPDFAKIRNADGTESAPNTRKPFSDLSSYNSASEHMAMLYTKYNSADFTSRDGNTVRSFTAHWGTMNNKELLIFNLTSLTQSEEILSATLHYCIGDQNSNTQECRPPKFCAYQRGRHQIPVRLDLWSFDSNRNRSRNMGNFFINVTSGNCKSVPWQWRDITFIINEAKRKSELLIGIDISLQGLNQRKKVFSHPFPYILVYANDSDISEAENVVSSIQNSEGPLPPGLHRLEVHQQTDPSQRRIKRSTNVLLPLQNNELPGAEYQYTEAQAWRERNPYKTLEARPTEKQKNKKKQRKSNRHKVQMLQFDEKTLKKARRKQWNEPRNCARRYLKVDFADIGWSEWIISPKSFDAYYCSGSCQFPMPKVGLHLLTCYA
ncbi:BMP3 protein, partial [Polypterus senegalus]|nr:BMP3 protein [Polypterus senegalus]